MIFIFRKIRDIIRYLRRIIYINKIEKGLGRDFTIISSNCFGGRIYQDLRIPYLSPTAGLFFVFSDYVRFVEKFKEYINRPIEIVLKSKWDYLNERMKSREFTYPIGKIKGTDIEIHFLHYRSAEDAIDKWYRRVQRINHDNITFIGFYQNIPNKEDAEQFLKMNNTILFSTIKFPKYKNCIYIKEFKDLSEAPNPYVFARIYYKYLTKYFKKK